MKTFFIIFLTIGINFLVCGQTPSCKSLHVGSFKITAEESGTTFITRTEKFQTEENETLGYKIIFDITWINDCTYELRPKELIKGDPWIMGDGTNVLKSRIKNITDKSYVAETSSNFSDGFVDFEVEIIKPKAITPNFSLH